MKNLILSMSLLVTMVLTSGKPLFAPALKIPSSKASVMLDGQIEPGEWDKALKVKVSDSLSLYFQQDASNLYLALANPFGQQTLMAVDFYVEPEEHVLLNLHASAKLGERTLQGQDYGEWNWWNNRQWYANVVRTGNNASQRFIFDEAKEFQIRKSRLKNRNLKLMFEITYPESMMTTFPANAASTSTENWLMLVL